MLNLCKSCKYFNQCGDYSRVEPCNGYAVNIPTPEEVEKEITAQRETFNTLKAKEDEARAAFKTLTKTEGIRADETRKALETLKSCEVKSEAAKKIMRVLDANMRVAIYNNALPIIVEEFKRYAGKPYGEKTMRKISDAINERAGVRVYIDTRFGISDNIHVYVSRTNGTRADYDIYTEWNEETRSRPAFLIGNKINADAFDSLSIPQEIRAESYIVDPETYNNHLETLTGEIEVKRAELEAVIHQFNDFCSNSDDHYSTYINIKR